MFDFVYKINSYFHFLPINFRFIINDKNDIRRLQWPGFIFNIFSK